MADSGDREKEATDFDIAKTAVYEFTKSFLLAGKEAFIKLDGSIGNKYVDTFGNVIGGAVGFVVPGTSKAAAALSKKPFDYGDKKLQKSRKATFMSILDSYSKYSEDEFHRLFIERGVSVFLAYETSLKKINCKVGKGVNRLENKRRAMQKLGKYAGSICLETIIETESAELEKLLETLRTPSNTDPIRSWYRRAKVKVVKAKFYFFVPASESNGNKVSGTGTGTENEQSSGFKKKHLTAAEIFLSKLQDTELCEEGSEASPNGFWCLNIEESAVVELTSAAISTDRKLFHAFTLLAPIQDVQVNLKEIQKKLDCLANKEKTDPTLISLVDNETDLTWDLKEISINVKLLSESEGVQDYDDKGHFKDIFSQMSTLEAKEKKLESLKDELEVIRQKIVELKNSNLNWDTFHTQNMYISNKEDLEKLAAVMKENGASLNAIIRINFSDKYSKKEKALEKLHANLELCAIQNVTDASSLEAMREANNCILEELTTIGSELPEIKEALVALQKIQLHSDTTTFSLERSLTAAAQIAQKNQNGMEQLSKLLKESQGLYKIISAAIEEFEQIIHHITLNSNDSENSFVLKTLQENEEDQNQNINKLDEFTGNILLLAPSFKITSSDFRDRLKELNLLIATQIYKQQKDVQTPAATKSDSKVHREEADAFNILPKQMRWSNQIGGFPRRWGHAAVAVENRVYSFGGINQNGDPTYSKKGPLDAFVLNVNDCNMEWAPLSLENKESNPSQRLFHTAVAYKEFIVIFGGLEARSFARSNTTFRFNTQTLKWDALEVSGNIPGVRCLHSAVVIKNQMLVFGGKNDKIKVSNDLHSLDLDTFHWSTISTKGIPPSLCRRHSAAAYKDRFMFIFGGKDSDAKTRANDLFCFDVVTKEWKNLKTSGTTPQGRSGHSALAHNGLIFVFGGADNQNSFLNDVFCFNPETCEWKEVKPSGQPPSPRTHFGCVAPNDRVFVFGGYNRKDLDETFLLENE